MVQQSIKTKSVSLPIKRVFRFLLGWRSARLVIIMFKLPELDIPAFVADTVGAATPEHRYVMNLVASNMEKQNLVPAPFEGFVPWGNYSNLKKIVKSGMFYPVFITGLVW